MMDVFGFIGEVMGGSIQCLWDVGGGFDILCVVFMWDLVIYFGNGWIGFKVIQVSVLYGVDCYLLLIGLFGLVIFFGVVLVMWYCEGC